MAYSQRDKLTWKGTKLFHEGLSQPVAELIRDTKYPDTMWRFRLLPNGELSDMVNLSRVKDATAEVAVHTLNKRHEQFKRAQEGERTA